MTRVVRRVFFRESLFSRVNAFFYFRSIFIDRLSTHAKRSSFLVSIASSSFSLLFVDFQVAATAIYGDDDVDDDVMSLTSISRSTDAEITDVAFFMYNKTHIPTAQLTECEFVALFRSAR